MMFAALGCKSIVHFKGKTYRMRATITFDILGTITLFE